VGYSVAASGTWGWVCSAGFISSPTILYGIFGAGGSGLFYESSPEWSSMLGALGRGRAAGGGPERREARPGSAGSSDRGAQGPNGQGFHRAKRRRGSGGGHLRGGSGSARGGPGGGAAACPASSPRRPAPRADPRCSSSCSSSSWPGESQGAFVCRLRGPRIRGVAGGQKAPRGPAPGWGQDIPHGVELASQVGAGADQPFQTIQAGLHVGPHEGFHGRKQVGRRIKLHPGIPPSGAASP